MRLIPGGAAFIAALFLALTAQAQDVTLSARDSGLALDGN
jgi:hypothetical protein